MRDGRYRESRSSAERRPFLATLPAERHERRLALAVVVISAAIFLSAVPFAKVPIGPVWAFIPIYQSALAINDVITAVLLFGQFACLRSRGVLVLAAGYLFTALMAVSHMLTFPGVFAPTGLLGAGPQSTAWMFMFWHGGFPMCVVAYALLKHEGREPSEACGSGGPHVLVSIGATFVAVCGFTFLATAGQNLLPPIMRGNHFTSTQVVAIWTVWGLSLLALALLWRRRPRSVLDLWLMVVMCAWLFDIALAGMLNAARFDLGFYAGRIYGLLAATFVLTVLLVENGKLYFELDRQNRSLEAIVHERTERLLQSEKIATMGSLLAGVAHELNNPLAVVLWQTHLLRESVQEPKIAAGVEKVMTGAERCVRIVRNFLALARQQTPERTQVGLNGLVEDSVELLAYELRNDNVEVVLSLAADLPILWADGHQLQQVLVNMITNAHHAVRQRPADARMISITTRSDLVLRQVHIEIADTGPGIASEIRGRIFEPFFTTKPVGQGTGLGLSLCRGIVDEHGGTITVESEPGQCTTFHITLPVTVRPASADTSSATETAPPVGTKMILVVDDERDLAEVLVEALGREGHRVEIAGNGADALRRLEQHRYDLVVSDTKMPVMDGVELFHEIERRFPALRQRIIFVTGDVLDVEKRRFLESSGAPVLTKPFDLGEVRRLVRRVLVS
ncbi:MAG TPA: MASE4 domain-containing protein [Gemmatimonadales bacterium]|nr:MASE4 domain-containing protein [Gemmatimonadales bacterium]